MKTSTITRSLVLALGVTGAAYALGGCVVAARPAYANYGYTTVAQPNTVYYQGGNYGGTYYQPGYYHRHAPFFSGSTVVVAQPQYGNTVVVAQPQQQQVVYGRPRYGVGVGAAVAVPTVNAGFNAGVRVGP
jgi:hypothetical protein